MKITFIGVGEACDATHPNTSLLVETGEGHGRQILLDCGFTVPHLYFRDRDDPDALDGLWISHFHGDHFFGVPLLLLRFWEMGRKKPLLVLGPQGVEEKVEAAMELAYPGFLSKLRYDTACMVVEPGNEIAALGCRWRTAENIHSERALSVRMDCGGESLFYSGDGRPTRNTLTIAKGCGLMVHEAFRLEEKTAGHGSVRNVIDFALEAGAAHLAVVHVERGERKKRRGEIEGLLNKSFGEKGVLPEAGDCFVLP